jgi:hypothetical protein
MLNIEITMQKTANANFHLLHIIKVVYNIILFQMVYILEQSEKKNKAPEVKNHHNVGVF